MSAISEKVIAISKPYLGPATEKFMVRQCLHLKVEVAALEATHLQELAKWVNISGSLIMDPAKASDLARKITQL